MELYIGTINDWKDLSGIELLDEQRRDRLFRYRRAEDRARCLMAGLMLRTVFGAEKVKHMEVTQFGKLYLPVDVKFNLSHSNELVVLLVDVQEVGVDVEYISDYPRKVAEKVFTEKEQSWLWEQNERSAFYRLWTGKEAVMKALGLGFWLPPESFEISPEKGIAGQVCRRDWYLHWSTVRDHMICTASETSKGPERIIELSKEDLL